jgi:type I restriction enzyme S subunit
LRFPEFDGEWEVKKLGEVTDKIGDGLHGTPIYIEDSGFYFINGNNLVNGKIELNDNTKRIDLDTFSKNNKGLNENTLLISINGTIGSIAKYNQEKVMLGKSVGYFNFNNNSVFFYFALQTNSIQDYFISELTGSTIKNLSLKTLRETAVSFPSATEQQKISNFLSIIDERIQTQSKIIGELKVLKSTVSKKLFSQQLRFKDEGGNGFPDWEVKKLGECLDYIQPTKYLVSSTEYDNSYKTPVLTAGKTFILGYTNETNGIFENNLPIIIFDDFTTATQFVDFPFKAKSSAMKILAATKGVHIKFIYEAMQFLNYEMGGHERHWISKFAPIEILVPLHDEQTKIAGFLSEIDEKIEIEKQLLSQYENQKKYLLQNLFI